MGGRIKLKTLVFYLPVGDRFSYYVEWLDVFRQCESLKTTFWPLLRVTRNSLKPGNLVRWGKNAESIHRIFSSDVIVLLHSVFSGDCSRSCRFPSYLIPLANRRKGKLVVFLINEYKDFGFKNRFLSEIRCDLLVSALPPDVAGRVYPSFQKKLLSLPYGAVNERVFQPFKDYQARPIDLGTRSVPYTPLVGDTDRNDLIRFVQNQPDVKVDVSQESDSRFDRAGWAGFLNECKATPSTEVGSRYIDPEGKFQSLIEERLREGEGHPDFEQLATRCRDSGHILYSGKHIGGRHFEAMATKTVQVMFPGRFNDLLKPGIHYLGLNRDFSNWPAIKDQLRDGTVMKRIADEAYHLAMSQFTYRTVMERFMKTLNAMV